MPEPLSGMIVSGAVGWVISKMGDSAGKGLKGRWTHAGAQRDLGEIGARAVEAAISVAPELAGDLRSEAYVKHVLAQDLVMAVQDATRGLDAEDLAAAFIARFIMPQLRGRDRDEVLRDLYRLEPERLQRAFAALVEAVRSGLSASPHWRAAATALGVEETRLGVLGLRRLMDAHVDPKVDLKAARKDALAGSEGLRTWEKTIAGLHLNRPEVLALRERIRQAPAGTTLLTGPAGSGKSAVLSELTALLEEEGLTVFALKADQLDESVRSLADIGGSMGMIGDLPAEIEALAAVGPVVLVIDQLDAVSEIMDRSSQRMRLLLQLATRWRTPGKDDPPPVHVIVSSRPFEAQYDARFQALDAKQVILSQPAWDAVAALLNAVGVPSEHVPVGLHETLRRPFQLKLFVEVARRGEPIDRLVEGELLNAWLRTAPLGDAAARRGVLDLLKAMAEDMTETETLWRPADRFDQDFPDAVGRAQACELVVRQDRKLGFAHQGWLDDFQARAFRSGRALAEYAWSSQDGLFGRATILRALERFRALEPMAYADAIDLLLGDGRTRRHLRHLTVDLIATQPDPSPREQGWVLRLVDEDAILARRAVRRLLTIWAGWRAALKPRILGLRGRQDYAYSAVGMTVAEAAIDPLEAERLLLAGWSGADADAEAFEICWRGRLWSPGVRVRLAENFARATPEGYAISDYVTDLAASGRAADAAGLLGLYLDHLAIEARVDVTLHGIDKVAEADPGTFVAVVLPWVLRQAERAVTPEGGVRDQYPRSQSLPFEWRAIGETDSLYTTLQAALNRMAEAAPEAFCTVAASLDAIEIDDIQARVGEGFAAGGPAVAVTAADWLLADRRRLRVGLAHIDDEEGVGHIVEGWSTRQLLKACAAHLDKARLERVRDAIETWDIYREEARLTTDAEQRRDWRRYAEAERAALLALLPTDALGARRRRQVEEQLAEQPRLGNGRGAMMASFVGPPMSHLQMANATDDDLFRMIDLTPDNTERRLQRGRRGLVGGVSQLAQAFAAFGKDHPARAMALVRARFRPGRHEMAAGALVQKLSEAETVAAADLLALIHELEGCGFASQSWRHDAAFALQALAGRLGGLADPDLVRLESWIESDPQVMADRVTRRRNQDEANRERNARPDTAPQAVLFGRGLGGSLIFPQGNHTLLDAIAKGVLGREPADVEAWVSVLERHVARPEDPQVWTLLLAKYFGALYHADRDRAQALLRAIWAAYPEAFTADVAGALWRHRQMLPSDLRLQIVLAWLADPEPRTRRLAGEFIMAGRLVDPEDTEALLLSEALFRGEPGPARLGAIFGAAAAWRDDDPRLRAAAHAVLEPIASSVKGDDAVALATALNARQALRPDAHTREILVHALANPDLLAACRGAGFPDGLQELLLHPGFEDLVLRVAEGIFDGYQIANGNRIGFGSDRDLVAIAVALQRSGGALRVQAMDFYERLLDADTHGATQAAEASLKR
jgi:energy-coupling factor transporter ATP-binding protein EcfA2